jgi:hypothetical protein
MDTLDGLVRSQRQGLIIDRLQLSAWVDSRSS